MSVVGVRRSAECVWLILRPWRRENPLGAVAEVHTIDGEVLTCVLLSGKNVFGRNKC